MAIVCHWRLANRQLGSLFGLAIWACVMGPCKQKDYKCESDAGRGKDHGLNPATLWCDLFIEARADARQERSRYLGVGGHVKAGVDGGEQGLLPRECGARSEEHTSELQSLAYLVCRLLLEKKKTSKRTLI